MSKTLLRVITVLSLSLSCSLARAQFHPLIIGGDEAQPGEFPSIVSLQDDSGLRFCGGTLIRPNWVLTAAHCISGHFVVVTGLNSRDPSVTPVEKIEVDQAFSHPQHSVPIEGSHDYALVKLKTASKSPTLALNRKSLNIPTDLAKPMMATVAGWGSQWTVQDVKNPKQGPRYPTQLLRVDLALVDQARCEEAYPHRIDETMICAGFDEGGKDSCDGDSGGPLILKNANGSAKLIGVVSWGDGCAVAHQFGIYSRVDAAVDWIDKTINEN